MTDQKETQGKETQSQGSYRSDEQKERVRSHVWEDLLFGAIDRIASTPGRLKDPKETISSAFDWVKGIREEVAERVKEEVSTRIGKLDFNQISARVADHLAKNYEIKVDARVRWVKKEASSSIETEEVKVTVVKDNESSL